MSERLTEQLAMTNYYFRLVYQKAVVRYAKECGCSAPTIRQLPLEEQIKLFQDGRCLNFSCRYLCMLRKQVGIVARILGIIPFLLSQCRIIDWSPLCPYSKYRHRQLGCQSQQRRTWTKNRTIYRLLSDLSLIFTSSPTLASRKTLALPSRKETSR